jgi:hypothetical protein
MMSNSDACCVAFRRSAGGGARGFGDVIEWSVTYGDESVRHAALFARPLPVEYARTVRLAT